MASSASFGRPSASARRGWRARRWIVHKLSTSWPSLIPRRGTSRRRSERFCAPWRSPPISKRPRISCCACCPMPAVRGGRRAPSRIREVGDDAFRGAGGGFGVGHHPALRESPRCPRRSLHEFSLQRSLHFRPATLHSLVLEPRPLPLGLGSQAGSC